MLRVNDRLGQSQSDIYKNCQKFSKTAKNVEDSQKSTRNTLKCQKAEPKYVQIAKNYRHLIPKIAKIWLKIATSGHSGQSSVKCTRWTKLYKKFHFPRKVEVPNYLALKLFRKYVISTWAVGKDKNFTALGRYFIPRGEPNSFIV